MGRSDTGTVLSSFAWQGIAKMSVQGFAWASTIVVARILSPADYGLMATVGIFTGIFFVLVQNGFAAALIQKDPADETEENAVFAISIGIGLTAYTILYLGAPFVGEFYDNVTIASIIRVAGIALFLDGLQVVPSSRLLRQMDFRRKAYAEISAGGISTLTVLTSAVWGAGVWSLVAGFLAQSIVLNLAYLLVTGWWPGTRVDFRKAWHRIDYGAKVMTSSLLAFIYRRADIIVISKLLGEHSLGYYSMAFQLAILPMDKLGTIFNQVAMPAMARIVGNLPDSQKLFLDLHQKLLFTTYPLFVGLALVSDDAVKLLLTGKWMPIVPVMQGLCLVNLLRVSAMLMPTILNGRGKATLVVKYSTACSVVLPVAFYYGAHEGLQGVVYAWAIAFTLLYGLLLYFQLSDLKIALRHFVASILPVIAAVGTMAVAVVGFRHSTVEAGTGVRLIGSIATGGASYLLALAMIYRTELPELRRKITIVLRRKQPA